MKNVFASLLALMAGIASFAADGVPLFNATLTVGKEHRFVLVSEAGRVSSFLRLGESFDGYLLKEYDARSGTLALERGGQVIRVTLVTDAAIAAGQTVTPATLADAEAVMTAMNFEVMIDKMLAQSKKAQLGMVDQIMGQVTRSETDKQAAMALQTRLMEELLGVLRPEELKADMAKIYSQLFSKEELNALAAFYTTPIGQKLNERQPEVQEKLNAAIMPRMMAVMPKIKQMTQEFAAEQRAKRAGAGGGTPPPAPAAKP